jgi:hypothetical protein
MILNKFLWSGQNAIKSSSSMLATLGSVIVVQPSRMKIFAQDLQSETELNQLAAHAARCLRCGAKAVRFC